MEKRLWKTCIGGIATAVFCVATCAQSFGAEAKSIEDMEKELNALKASVAGLTEQIQSVKQEKVATAPAAAPAGSKEDIDALRSEVHSLKDEMKTAAEGEQALKAADIQGNVYSEFAKRVKLGGQIRTRAEYANGWYNVPDLTLPGGAATGANGRPKAGIDDDYVLNQTRLWADADVNEHLRMFIQVQDSRAFGVEGTTVGFADDGANNRMDIHQGYFDLKNLFEVPLTVRVGRQEIVWGDHRVIGNFVWSNQGRVFDGGRVMWDTDATHAEAFAARVDENGFTGTTSGALHDGDSNESVYAAQYAFKKLVPNALLELMYIQKNDQDSIANSAVTNGFAIAGAGNVVIHDIGARIDGKALDKGALDYTVEAHGQFGTYGDLTQRAYAGAAKTGYTFKDLAWTPRFGVEYCYASGDHDPSDSTHETFDNLYPTNHWAGNYGFIDLLSWQNVHDARANVKVMPTSKLTVQGDYHYFWLASAKDGWYFANGALASPRPTGVGSSFSSDSASLADEIDLTVGYDLYKNVKILAGYSFFDPNAWITQNIGSDIATSWGYLQTTVTF